MENKIESVLIKRDGLTEEEARKARKEGMANVLELISSGHFESAEEEFMSEFGLEPDFLLDEIILTDSERAHRE